MQTDALGEIVTCVARSASGWAERLPATGPHRTAMRILATDDYDVWLLGWPAAASVSPHDHGESAGAFTVVAGELQEIRWVDGQPYARRVPRGDTVTIAPGVVHDVVAGARHSVSLHAYAPPLVAMSYYDPAGSQVIRTEAVDHLGEFFGDARALHPSVAR